MKAIKDPATGSLVFTFLGSAKYSDPRSFGSFLDLESQDSFEFLVPCGKCLGCRIDYVRDWTARMVFELVDNSYKAVFVTLTYNDAHLPMTIEGPSLSKSDIQLFFKRLRSSFPQKLRYYICGEYGPKTSRPHYHAIIYGLSLSDFSDLKIVGVNELRQPYFSSDLFASIWKNGFVQISEVNYSTCSYVARYVTKKLVGPDEEDDFCYRVRPFNLSSRCPGIGFLNARDVVLSGDLVRYFSFSDGQRSVSVPRSFFRHLKRNLHQLSADEQQEFIKLCYQRSADSNDRLVSNVIFYGLPFPDYLKKCSDSLLSKFRLLPDRK